LPSNKRNNRLDVPRDVAIGVLESISETYIHVAQESILEELDRKGIKYENDTLDKMVAAGLLKPPTTPKTSQNKLYAMTEAGKALLEKEKS